MLFSNKKKIINHCMQSNYFFLLIVAKIAYWDVTKSHNRICNHSLNFLLKLISFDLIFNSLVIFILKMIRSPPPLVCDIMIKYDMKEQYLPTILIYINIQGQQNYTSTGGQGQNYTSTGGQGRNYTSTGGQGQYP